MDSFFFMPTKSCTFSWSKTSVMIQISMSFDNVVRLTYPKKSLLNSFKLYQPSPVFSWKHLSSEDAVPQDEVATGN